jgi:hypothetical protein
MNYMIVLRIDNNKLTEQTINLFLENAKMCSY